jgi:hypothetical protein
MTTDTMQITVIGELGRVPDIAGIIQASVRMYEGTGHEGFGDLFFEGLHITWTCSRHEQVMKLPQRGEKAVPWNMIGEHCEQEAEHEGSKQGHSDDGREA